MGQSSTKAFSQPCIELCKEQKLVAVKASDTVEEVLATLKEGGFSSVPVVGGDAVVGALDILSYLAENDFEAAAWDAQIEDVESRTIFVASSTSVREAVHQMLQQHVYRVAIREGTDSEISNMISQVDVLKFIQKFLKDLIKDPKQTINTMSSLGTSPVRTLSSDATVRDGLEELARGRISAMAVTNAAGGLIAPLSRYNFRDITKESLNKDLGQTLGQFVLAADVEKGIRVQQDQSLQDMIDHMVELRLHRVFVVDEKDHPVRVITLSDLIKYLVTNAQVGSIWASEEDKAQDLSILDAALAEFNKEKK